MPAFSRACLARKLAIVVVGSPATPLLKSIRACYPRTLNFRLVNIGSVCECTDR